MSVIAVAWAKTQKTGSPTLKAVLMAVADYADEIGRAWPSQVRIAEDTELSERAVRNALAELVERGLVTRQSRHRPDGSRSTDIITLKMSNEGNRNVVPGVGHDVPGVGNVVPGGGAPGAGHELPLNFTPTEPTVLSESAAAPPAEIVYIDATDELWRRGPIELVALGVPEKQIKGLIGTWRKAARDDAAVVLAAIRRAAALRIAGPIPWITQAVQQTPRHPARPPPPPSQASLWKARRTRSESQADEPSDVVPVQFSPGSERGHGPARGTLLEQDRGGTVRQIDDFGARRAFGR